MNVSLFVSAFTKFREELRHLRECLVRHAEGQVLQETGDAGQRGDLVHEGRSRAANCLNRPSMARAEMFVTARGQAAAQLHPRNETPGAFAAM